MDSIIAAWIEPTVGLATACAVGVGVALYRHSISCKQARKDLHDISRELLKELAELKGFVKGKQDAD